jgi:hypothetical protein
MPDELPQNIHIDVHQSFVPEIRIELLEVVLVVAKTSLFSIVFNVTKYSFLPIMLFWYPGSGSLVGISLQAYQKLFSVP